MIYLDQHTEPNEIARTLWREMGPEACLAIAITIAGSTVFDTWKWIGEPLQRRRT